MGRVAVETTARRTGRTLRALQAMPHGGVYVWVNNQLEYPKRMAANLGRKDIRIVGPGWLENKQWVGLDLSALRLDHAAREVLTEEQWEAYTRALDRVTS